MAVDLTTYSREHGHDKYDRYFPFFDAALSGHEVRRLLEIGTSARSITTWLNCFPHAEVVGLDTETHGPSGLDDLPSLQNERFTFVLGDQADTDLLASLGAFDAIFDDGGHHSYQQIASFETLFPLMNPGGWYFIEDLHCSYWSGYQDGGRTTMAFIKELLDDVHAVYTEPPGETRWPIGEIRLLDSLVAFRHG